MWMINALRCLALLSALGTGAMAVEQVSATSVTVGRGFFSEPFDLEITCTTVGATIRYRLDGTVPTADTGTVYAGPVSISSTTTLRAAAFVDGMEPSTVATHTYIFLADVLQQSLDGSAPAGWPANWGARVVDYGMDPDVVNHASYAPTLIADLQTLPSVSVVMDQTDLFGPTGIYQSSTEDSIAWERPASIEWILPSGQPGFQVDAGIRIRGHFSGRDFYAKDGFRLLFRAEYGDAHLGYPLFGTAGPQRFETLDLRTFQSASWSRYPNLGPLPWGRQVTFLHDQFSRDSHLAMGRLGGHGNFCHLYLNGQYWGLYNPCERPDGAYAATHLGGDAADYDIIKVNDWPNPFTMVGQGTFDAWRELHQLAAAGLASDAAYLRIQGRNVDGSWNPAYPKLIDIADLIDYQLLAFYTGNLDGPLVEHFGNTRGNNFLAMRHRSGRDGFRFLTYDAEHTMYTNDAQRIGPFHAGAGDPIYSNPHYLFQQLRENAEFRRVFADRIHRHFFNDGVFTPAAAKARFQARAGQIDRAVVGESARWGDAKRPAQPFTRDLDWVAAIANIVDSFMVGRTDTVLAQLRTEGLYPTLAAPVFNQHGGAIVPDFNLVISNPVGGDVVYTTDGSDPRLPFSDDIAPNATADPGGATVMLTGTTLVKARISYGGNWSPLTEALFRAPQDLSVVRITEIMHHPLPDGAIGSEALEFIELKNTGPTALDLSGAYVDQGVTCAFADGTTIPAGGFLIVPADRVRFAARYAQAHDRHYVGALADTATLALRAFDGSLIYQIAFGGSGSWPATSGTGHSLVPVDPAGGTSDPTAWRASSLVHGSPGADDPAPGLASSAMLITEILTNPQAPQAATIELHNPTTEPADVSGWMLSDDATQPGKHVLPAGTTIPAGGHLVILADDDADPANALPAACFGAAFSFSPHGGSVHLTSPGVVFTPDSAYSHAVAFGAAASGVSFGRWVISTGAERFPAQVARTFGAANGLPLAGPVVISEIGYMPDGGGCEFIELTNRTSTAILLADAGHPGNTWQVDGIGFTMPVGTVIPADGQIVLIGGAMTADAFRAACAVPPWVAIMTFPGDLADGGERIALRRPDAPDGMLVPMIEVDAIDYGLDTPWPSEPAGGGPSLARIDLDLYGDDPANWLATAGMPLVTPGHEAPDPDPATPPGGSGGVGGGGGGGCGGGGGFAVLLLALLGATRLNRRARHAPMDAPG